MDTQNFTIATIDDIKKLKEFRKEKDRWSNYYHEYPTNYSVQTPKDYLGDKDGMGFPLTIRIREVVISPHDHQKYYHYNYTTNGHQHILRDEMKGRFPKLPLFVLIQYSDYNSYNSKVKLNDNLRKLAETAKTPTLIGKAANTGYYHHDASLGSANLAVSIEYNGQRFWAVMPFYVAEQVLGLEVTEDMKLRLSNGEVADFDGYQDILASLHFYNRYRKSNDRWVNEMDFTYDSLYAVESQLGMGRKNLDNFLKALVKGNKHELKEPGNLSGIRKTWNRILPIMEEVLQDNPLAVISYRSIAQTSGRSVEGVKISAIFNEMFADVKNKDDFQKALKVFYTGKEDGDLYEAHNRLEGSIKRLPIYKEKRKAIIKNHADRAFAKIQEEAENLTIDKKKHKRTWKAIEDDKLPLGTFFRKSEQYFLLNDNWDLWEEMFKRGYGDQACELANEVKGRTTYEKDLMSYFYFVLYALPEYLKRHTGHKWTCSPRLVNSASELDPPKEGDDGVARQRSALTPIVDNDKHHVEVPYASLAISGGFGTTYCYSHDYHVLTKGFSFNGYAVTSEVEKCLNGRDDYGLMFYTLTGSPQGRGYPSFLIIFERRKTKGDVRVHFHRSHPFRSKSGDYNPIHNWIKGCYNWVAGNIRRDDIKAQQGDLFFVRASDSVVGNLEFKHKVNQYDNHKFEEAVPFAEYTKAAKSNILGYVQLEKDTWLRHNEHDDVLIPLGTYAIHQCRSWEANPKGVWSLRID